MKKYITLGLFLINSLSVFCNSDCDNINGFLKKNGINGVECCGKSHYILCKDDSDSIESIYLDDNVISNTMTSISFSDFPILEKLKHLTFTSRSDKFISIFNKSLPERFFELPNLEILEISKANITTIPNNLSSNNKIAKINLNNNELIAFPYQLKNLKKLVELDISRNNINCEITNEIKDFKSIETLIIGGNSINGNLVIPESLKNINLNNNLVSSISLSGSKNLKSFEGRNNNFNDNIIKTFIDAEVKLKSLTLGSNKNIKNIPENIYTLNTLENLDLSGTSISSLPKNMYALSNLKYLNLADLQNLNSPIVTFGSEINVCNFENTIPQCYQQNTCSFVFGYSSTFTKECSDYEIKTIHDIDYSVYTYVNKNYNLIKKIIIGVLIFIGAIILLRIIYIFIKKCIFKSKKEKKDKEQEIDFSSGKTELNNSEDGKNDEESVVDNSPSNPSQSFQNLNTSMSTIQDVQSMYSPSLGSQSFQGINNSINLSQNFQAMNNPASLSQNFQTLNSPVNLSQNFQLMNNLNFAPQGFQNMNTSLISNYQNANMPNINMVNTNLVNNPQSCPPPYSEGNMKLDHPIDSKKSSNN